MGENKKKRKQISSMLERIAEHELKIADELRNDQPDYILIEGWEHEIKIWRRDITQKFKRLPEGR